MYKSLLSVDTKSDELWVNSSKDWKSWVRNLSPKKFSTSFSSSGLSWKSVRHPEDVSGFVSSISFSCPEPASIRVLHAVAFWVSLKLLLKVLLSSDKFSRTVVTSKSNVLPSSKFNGKGLQQRLRFLDLGVLSHCRSALLSNGLGVIGVNPCRNHKTY